MFFVFVAVSDQPVVNDTENSPDKELDDEFPVAIQSMSGEKGTIIVSAVCIFL